MRQNTPSFLFQSLSLLSCLALVTFLPSLHFMPAKIWHHDNQRLLELTMLTFVLLAAVFNREKPYFYQREYKKTCYAFTIFLILASFSALLAQSPRYAITEVCVFTALSYFSILIARLYIKNKDIFIKRLIYAIWAAILLYLFAFYVGYISAIISKIPLPWPHPFTGFSNIRTFNQYQLWSLGLASLPLLAFNLKNSLRYGLYIALTLWWVLLFYSASRGALLAWLVGIITIAAIYQKLAWPLIRLQLFNMATGFCAYFMLFKLPPILNGSTLVTGTVLRETTSGRLDLWHQAVILIKGSPWLGIGPMHYAWHTTISAHPHNSVLQLAAEFGIPAALIMLAIAGYSFYGWIKKFSLEKVETANKLDKQLTVILLFTLITSAAYSLVDGVIVMPLSQVMMFMVIGLSFGHFVYEDTYNIKIDTSTTQNAFNFSAIFAGITLMAMAWSVQPEVVNGLSGHAKAFSTEQSALGPRLWRQVYSQEDVKKALARQYKR